MRNRLFILAALIVTALVALMLAPVALIAQAGDSIVVPPPFPTDPGGLTLDFLLQWTDAVYAALVIGFGYLSNKIPGINKIPKTAWRVAAIALILAMAFLVLGKSVPLALLFSYFGATKLYDLLLSLFKKTPKPAEPAPKKPTPA